MTAPSPGTVGSAISGWSGFLGALSAYSSGSGTEAQLVAAASSFAASTAALTTNSPYAGTFSNVTGLASSLANINSDINSYNAAQNSGDTVGQDAAAAAIVNDASGIGGGLATGLNTLGNALGDSSLTDAASTMSEASGIIGVASAGVQAEITTVQAFTQYLQKLDNAIQSSSAIQQDIDDSDPEGDGGFGYGGDGDGDGGLAGDGDGGGFGGGDGDGDNESPEPAVVSRFATMQSSRASAGVDPKVNSAAVGSAVQLSPVLAGRLNTASTASSAAFSSAQISSPNAQAFTHSLSAYLDHDKGLASGVVTKTHDTAEHIQLAGSS